MAKTKLKEWLPSLEEAKDLRPADLGQYLSVARLSECLKPSSAVLTALPLRRYTSKSQHELGARMLGIQK